MMMMEGKAITSDVLRSSIQIEATSGEGLEERRKALPLKVVTWLQFSFRGIKQVDYLLGFEHLTRLQFDNNNLSKIEKLDHLTTLTELDLSFNNIEKIEGLEKLTRLLDLSLYNNKLTTIEGLDKLEEIKSLSLGNNSIKDLDKVMYLRQFRNLRLLCLEGNPCCKDPEYKLYTIAFMRALLYLDHHLCFTNLIKQAREQYQDAIQEMRDKENKEKIAWKERVAKEAENRLFAKANLLGIDEFFDTMLAADPEHKALSTVPNLINEAFNEYKERFLIVAEDCKNAIVELHNIREEETRLHAAARREVLAKRDSEGRTLCTAFHKRKKKVFQECQQDRTTAEPKLKAMLDELDKLQEKLFEIEVETYGEVNALWNEYEEAFFTTIDADKQHFANFYGAIRMAENRYSEVISVTSSVIMDHFAINDADDEVENEEARKLVKDKDVFMNSIQASKDCHGLSMDQAEDIRVKNEEALRKRTYDEGIGYMIQRNRERVSEIWFFIKRYQDEINIVIKQVLHGDLGSQRSRSPNA